MFSRGSRTSGRHARDDKSRRGRSRTDRSLAEELDLAGEATEAGSGSATPAAPAAPEPAGPYDISEAPEGMRLLDLGSLKIPSVPGVEVRVQANQEGVVQQVYLVHGESLLQLGVFAAPRTESIWDEVRAEIRKSLFDDGVAAEEIAGEYGTELRARVRTQQGLKDLRFVGVSGPRWLARAVYQGPAAVDPANAGPLAECLRGVVVDRGDEAKPAKEPLPLRLSKEMAEQVRGRSAAGQGDPSAAGASGVPTNGSTPAAAGAAGPAVPDGRAPNGGGAPAGGGAAGDAPASGAPATGGAPAGGAPSRRKPSPRPRRRE